MIDKYIVLRLIVVFFSFVKQNHDEEELPLADINAQLAGGGNATGAPLVDDRPGQIPQLEGTIKTPNSILNYADPSTTQCQTTRRRRLLLGS